MGLINHRFTTPYNPRANGVVERANTDVTRMLKALCNGKTTAWPLFLPRVQLNMNNMYSRTHHSSPFSLMFLRKCNPDIMTDPSMDLSIPINLNKARSTNEELWKQAEEVIFPGAAKSLREYQMKQREQFERHNKLLQRHPTEDYGNDSE